MANSAKKGYNTACLDHINSPDVQSSHNYWNWDCGLLAMDYGSETTGYDCHNCKANTHTCTVYFFHVDLKFLPVLHIVNSLKITKTLNK